MNQMETNEFTSEETEIVRDRVIGYAISVVQTEQLAKDKPPSNFLWVHGIVGTYFPDSEGSAGAQTADLNDLLDKNERIVGVLPAPVNTFKLGVCCDLCGTYLYLGYEFEGATPPENGWQVIAREELMKHKAHGCKGVPPEQTTEDK